MENLYTFDHFSLHREAIENLSIAKTRYWRFLPGTTTLGNIHHLFATITRKASLQFRTFLRPQESNQKSAFCKTRYSRTLPGKNTRGNIHYLIATNTRVPSFFERTVKIKSACWTDCKNGVMVGRWQKLSRLWGRFRWDTFLVLSSGTAPQFKSHEVSHLKRSASKVSFWRWGDFAEQRNNGKSGAD